MLAVLATVIGSLGLVGALITTDRYLVPAGERVEEDQYVTSTSAIVEGVVDGNLTVFTGSLEVSGTVTGSVNVFTAGSVTVTETGRIDGSLNGAAGSVTVRGRVGSDVFVAAGSTVVEEPGSVGRDAIAFGGTFRIEGSVDRDVRGRAYRITVDGSVGGDVDIAAQSLGVSSSATIGGDVLYRSPTEASIDPGATIGGTVTRLPTQSNFIYSLVLSIANVVSFLGFLVAGIAAIWILRGTSSRAVGSILTKPFRTLLAGIVVVIVFPLLIGLLAVTLVGLPLALVAIAIGVILFVIGAVPAVTALGNLVLLRRGGLFGAFLIGAVIWRLSFFIPWIGGFLFLLGLIWGIGGWALGAVAARRSDPSPVALFPASISERTDRAEDWEPPLAPGSLAGAASDTHGEVTGDAAIEDDAQVDGAMAEADVPEHEGAPDDGSEPDEVEDGAADGGADPGGAAHDPADDGADEALGFALDDGFVDEGADDSAEPAAGDGGGEGADAEEDDVAEDDVAEDDATPSDRSPIVGGRVTFDSPIDDRVDEGVDEPAQVSGGAAGSDDEPIEGADGGSDDEPVSLSDRFQALREELLATGTVESVERDDDDSDEPDEPDGDGDWGLPDR